MDKSILQSTKKILGIDPNYSAFDLDVITHINAALSTLDQLGVIPAGYSIEDESSEWDELGLPQNQLSMVKTYVYLKVRMVFDPPTTSFMIDAANQQLKEYEYRISYFREELVPIPDDTSEEVDV